MFDIHRGVYTIETMEQMLHPRNNGRVICQCVYHHFRGTEEGGGKEGRGSCSNDLGGVDAPAVNTIYTASIEAVVKVSYRNQVKVRESGSKQPEAKQAGTELSSDIRQLTEFRKLGSETPKLWTSHRRLPGPQHSFTDAQQESAYPLIQCNIYRHEGRTRSGDSSVVKTHQHVPAHCVDIYRHREHYSIRTTTHFPTFQLRCYSLTNRTLRRGTRRRGTPWTVTHHVRTNPAQCCLTSLHLAAASYQQVSIQPSWGI